MSNIANGKQDATPVDSLFKAIAVWVTGYRDKFRFGDEFTSCAADEVRRVADDLHVTPDELRELARKGPGAAGLLQKMLVALKVDPVSLGSREPGVVQDLQRLCTMCEQKNRCARELAQGTAAEHFHEFCPNALTIDALLNEVVRPH